MGMRNYNLGYLREISGGDEDFVLDMIQTFITNTPAEISTLKNLAMKQSWVTLGEHAHKFAPGLQFIGLVSMRPVINKIEDFSFKKENLEQIVTLIEELDSECQLVSEQLRNDFNL